MSRTFFQCKILQLNSPVEFELLTLVLDNLARKGLEDFFIRCSSFICLTDFPGDPKVKVVVVEA